MNKLMALITIVCFAGNIYAQRGTIVTIGGTQKTFESEDLLTQAQTLQAATFSIDWIPAHGFGIGFEGTKTINEATLDYLNVKMNLGCIINGKSRLQFPLMMSVGYFRFKEIENTLSGFGGGGKLGLRLYVTDRFFVEGSGEINYGLVSNINGEYFEESVGALLDKSFSIGIGYYFSKSKF